MTTTTAHPNAPQTRPDEQPGKPWWKHGLVWLIISGPAAVVIASIFTVSLALKNPDHVVDKSSYQQNLARNQHLKEAGKSLAPAHQARNHAATSAADQPPPALADAPPR